MYFNYLFPIPDVEMLKPNKVKSLASFLFFCARHEAIVFIYAFHCKLRVLGHSG